MTNIITIRPAPGEVTRIFEEALVNLSDALEKFMMIEKHDSDAKVMVERVYEVLTIGERFMGIDEEPA